MEALFVFLLGMMVAFAAKQLGNLLAKTIRELYIENPEVDPLPADVVGRIFDQMVENAGNWWLDRIDRLL